jgi:hypothetical protein
MRPKPVQAQEVRGPLPQAPLVPAVKSRHRRIDIGAAARFGLHRVTFAVLTGAIVFALIVVVDLRTADNRLSLPTRSWECSALQDQSMASSPPY